MKTKLYLLSNLIFWIAFGQNLFSQNIPQLSDQEFKNILLQHKEFVSIPNLPSNKDLMLENINWVAQKYEELDFKTELLPSSTLPILFVEKEYDPSLKTILFYFHIDGQPVNANAWSQDDPFVPVLKENREGESWEKIDWTNIQGDINMDWRIFARAAADDKAPILMFLSAIRLLKENGQSPKFNIKVIFDPEEEYSSKALLSTLETYKSRYVSDFFVVMDGPAHNSNRPTVTFGCRGIVTCSITTYGAKLPQHSGHYGNYAPNPVFALSNILSNMKDEEGNVLIDGYYDGIEINRETQRLLESVPYDRDNLNKSLGISESEKVGNTYQESLQYPTLNIRQIGTSWRGEGLKTVIPEYVRADIDIRLVPETKGKDQIEKIKKHIESEGYYVIDREPTDQERQNHKKIVKFVSSESMDAFRTDPDSNFGQKIRASLKTAFDRDPVVIRLMGGTVPIVPLINELNVPTVIIPMVNMDNNQHSPNENIRIGNIHQGINICLTLLDSSF